MQKKRRKSYPEIIIISILILFIVILLILNIIIIILSKSKLKKRDIIEVKDIPIKFLKPFKFINLSSSSRPLFGSDNLGSAGEISLLCYSGTCNEGCEEDYCDRINYECSLECFDSKGETCNSCPSYFYENENYKEGKCSKKEDDIYELGKVCLADNIIYFWKGKKYFIDNSDDTYYTYLKNAKLKDEKCPKNTKNCGIIDDEKNKLCIPIYEKCPPNIISTSTKQLKLNQNNYFASEIDNETTIYYTYDENAINNKIIAGLYVDTDIYFNKEEEHKDKNPIILDTYTLSGFLKDNQKLYKGINLDYDPYKIDNIDQKGKSYLKVSYNKNPNLIFLRKKYNQFLDNKKWNENVANKTDKNLNLFFVGFLFYSYSLVFFILCLICGINNKCKNLIGILSFVFCAFFELFIISIIGAFKNISLFNKAKDNDPNENFNKLRILNYIYIILSLLLLVFLIASTLFTLYYCFTKKCKKINGNNSTPSETGNIDTNSHIIFNGQKHK